MAKCAVCGKTIILGGNREGDVRFCSLRCQRQGHLLQAAAQVPDDVVEHQVHATHSGSCPKCKGPGPVDVHESHQVWSAVLITRWKTSQTVGCRRCGVKAQLGDMTISLLAGWWGFPWGLIVTPAQIFRNLRSLSKPPDPLRPSPKLERLVRLHLARTAASGRQPQVPR
jgi:hypothetical protein